MAPSKRTMARVHLLAAEVFGYSYANYQDHLGIGNARFERLSLKRSGSSRKPSKSRGRRQNWLVSSTPTRRRLETSLSRYSRHLRVEPGDEYYEGYLDEED